MSVNIINALKNKKGEILELWMKNQFADSGLRDDLISKEEIQKQSKDLVNALVSNLNENNINNSQSSDFDQVIELLSGFSISRARQGFSPRETGNFILSLKEALLEILKQQSSNANELFEVSLKLSRLLDNFTILTFETFIKGREEVILRQTDEITDISTPVIKIWDGILVMPIIGTLDSARTQVVMENLLQKIVETGSSIAILDISGMPTVDSLVAQNLLKTVSATRLMGADCIISGMRPEIAQTIVHLGIDLSQIITKASLAGALQYAFKSLRLEVKTATSQFIGAPKQ